MSMKIWWLTFFGIINFGLSVAQTGPAGVGTNDGSSSLKLWLDADNGTYADTFAVQTATANDRVMLWKDLSGNNNNVSAKTDSTKPTLIGNSILNGAKALRFTRNAAKTNKRNYLSSKTFASTNDITIYCVFHALTESGGNNITPYKAKTYGPNMWYAGSGLVDAGANGFTNDISLAFCDTSLAAGSGDSTTLTDYCVKTPVSLRKTYFATLQKEAWNGKLSLSQNANTPVEFQAGAQPINIPTKYFIGSNSNITSPLDTPFFDGYIANVLVYNRLLNKAEKTILENYLSAKYEIKLGTNDLYTFDDSISGNYDHEVIGIGKALDGSFQASAKGEGNIELTNSSELDKGDFKFIGHNGKSLGWLADNMPEGIKNRIERTWIFSKTGNTHKVDLLVDPTVMPSVPKEDIVLLIDTDNNGQFSDEAFGKGMIPVSEVTSHGRLSFRGIPLQHGNRFTFAKLNPVCINDCEAFFSPNGDGQADIFYLDQQGKTFIYDRSGKFIKSMPTPAYWDGTDYKGEPAVPGLYFLVTNEDIQKTVTLIQ